MMYVAAILFVTVPGGLLALSICVRRLGLSLRDFSFQVLVPCLVPSGATLAAAWPWPGFVRSFHLFRYCSAPVCCWVPSFFPLVFSLNARERGTLVFLLKSVCGKIQFSK